MNTKKLWLFSLLLALVLLVSACKGSTSPPVSTATGEQLYKTNCLSCHGANGAGGLKIGEATAADIRAQVLKETFKNDSNLIKSAILDGMDEEGKDLNAAMLRFRGKLSDTDVIEIINYLKTLK